VERQARVAQAKTESDHECQEHEDTQSEKEHKQVVSSVSTANGPSTQTDRIIPLVHLSAHKDKSSSQ